MRKQKAKTKAKTKTKTRKVLPTPNVCCIFEKQGVQVYQEWHFNPKPPSKSNEEIVQFPRSSSL